MRTIITSIIFFLSCTVGINGQIADRTQSTIPESEVPEAVFMNQQELFPDGFITEWQLQRDFDMADSDAVRYIAKFTEASNPGFSASYLPTGELIFYSQFMQAVELPETIQLRTRSDFGDFQIDSANFITVFNPKREIYRIRLRDNNRLKHAYYTINAAPIAEESLPLELRLFDE
ncbi:MAG: hypothetical protein MK211_11460 [Flavobacteriales bacterium]|jgi:hypothetical protein|nr:hypothetical protein [Flavobacteriales bacterium]